MPGAARDRPRSRCDVPAAPDFLWRKLTANTNWCWAIGNCSAHSLLLWSYSVFFSRWAMWSAETPGRALQPRQPRPPWETASGPKPRGRLFLRRRPRTRLHRNAQTRPPKKPRPFHLRKRLNQDPHPRLRRQNHQLLACLPLLRNLRRVNRQAALPSPR